MPRPDDHREDTALANSFNWPVLLGKAVAITALMLATGFGFVGRIELLLGQGRHVTLLFFLGMWGLCWLALLAAAMQPNAWVRGFWAVLIALVTAAGWAYQTVSGSSLNVFDTLSLWAARHEAGRALGEYGAIAPWAAAVFAGTLLVIALPPALPRGWPRRVVAWLFWLPALPVALIAAIIFLRQGGGSQALPTQFQPLAVGLVAMQRQLTHAMPPRMAVPFAPARKPAVRHIVLLIDESIRADYLDFTPGNAATPRLPALLRTAADFGRAVSGGNCSSYANAILRFTAQPANMVKSARTWPTLWQWAKKAGFTTVYMDGQSGFAKDPGFLQNFMTMREVRFIDRVIRFRDTPATQLDFALLDRLVRLISTSTGPLFIIANKNGAHFPYDSDYPASARRFTPVMSTAGKKELRARVNSYRNAIAWNVDLFFHELLRRADLSDTLIIYTSDHGQNLDPKRLTHCSTQDPHPREGQVPLLAISGKADVLQRFRQAAEKNRHAASHFNIAPTLLRVMGYTPRDIATLYGPSLFDNLDGDTPHAFSYGDIFGLFSGKVRWQPVNTRRPMPELPAPDEEQRAASR